MCSRRLEVIVRARPEPVILVGNAHADNYQDYREKLDDVLTLRDLEPNALDWENVDIRRPIIMRIRELD